MKKKQRGYTLIEIVVATGIFLVLITLFVGIFSRFAAMQERSTQTQSVLEQLRVALEIMNRELRTGFGTTYDLSDNNGRGVVFRNQDGHCVHYRWEAGTLERAEAQGSGGSACSLQNFIGGYAALTSSSVVITALRFDVQPSSHRDGQLLNQGFVTVTLDASSARAAIAPVKMQSTVTSRQVIPYIPALF